MIFRNVEREWAVSLFWKTRLDSYVDLVLNCNRFFILGKMKTIMKMFRRLFNLKGAPTTYWNCNFRKSVNLYSKLNLSQQLPNCKCILTTNKF